MKPLLAAFLSLLLVGSVQAQSTDAPYKKVAVTSLIGDVITVDIYRKRVGTMIDSNLQEKLPVPTAVLDELALKTASDAVTKALPSASTATLSVAAPGSDLDPAQFLVDGRIAASHRLAVALRDAGFTHLLVITKQRAQARLKFASSSVGSGYLEGIGFYIDNSLNTIRVDTQEKSRGMIAPYVYIKLALVDLASLQQIREQVINDSTTRSAAGHAEALDAWGAVTPEEKVSLLQELIRENVSAAIPLLFKSN